MTVATATIIGGGLAGCEAAWQILAGGYAVTLYEMKPHRFSPAHRSPSLAELVCSNSLRSADPSNAVGLLKEEMRAVGSLVMTAASATAIPAGRALAVDRHRFSRFIEEELLAHPKLTLIREEVTALPPVSPLIIASGPLTSEALTGSICGVTGRDHLSFYDAISPIVDAASVNMAKVFRASRYAAGEGDYLNCPLDQNEYEGFWHALIGADEVPLKAGEEARYFEGCLPIEIIAKRGKRTLAFGPMKPVGLTDPRTGLPPYAVVQLRQEDRAGEFYNMVGFQTKLTWPEQRRIFRMIPGLEQAEFTRYGSVHRNTFLDGPALLSTDLQMKARPGIFFAGQITGVEGYVESAASGILAGLNALAFLDGLHLPVPPMTTALGALLRHVTTATSHPFQPSNVNFSLFPSLPGRTPRRDRGARYAQRALADLKRWISELPVPVRR